MLDCTVARFALVLLLAGASLLRAADDGGRLSGTTVEQKFRQANAAYSANRFEEAAAGYREVLEIAGPSAGLLYNLGCAQLKSGRLGEAVASFHRARRLAPRDPDIQANLRFIGALARPEGEEAEESNGAFLAALTGWMFLLTDREVALLQVALILWLSLGLVLLASGYRGALRQALVAATITGGLLFALNSLMLGAHLYRSRAMHEAVVVQPEAEARSGPGEDNTRVLVLPEGTMIRLREERGDWVLVSLPSGRSGWLQRRMVEEI